MINLNIVIGLFALAAIIGLTILIKVLKGQETSKPAVFAHGGLAAVALVLLVIYYIDNPEGLFVPLILFVIAALGGFYLFFQDITKQAIPKPVALIHAGAAVAAFVWLLLMII